MEAIKTPPPPEEMQLRLERVRGLMAAEGLEIMVAASTDNVYYLTNFAYLPFERPFFLIIPSKGRPTLAAPEMEISHAGQRLVGDVEYATYLEYPAPPGRTHADLLKELIPSGAAVGVEPTLPASLLEEIPGRKKITGLIEEARLVKTPYEVGRIIHACQVVDFGLNKALELSRPGTQLITVYGEGSRAMWGLVLMEMPQANVLATKFLCGLWPRTLSDQPHSVPGFFDALDEGGPHVVIITAQADGYSAELERTFFLDRVPDEARKPFEVMLEARRLGYETAGPGVPAAEVDDAVLNLIEKRGYGEYVLHRTGHGFGVTGHEGPWVARGSRDVLRENMVISIEPGIYIPGLGGFRHSDTVLITEKGAEKLTHGPETLDQVVF